MTTMICQDTLDYFQTRSLFLEEQGTNTIYDVSYNDIIYDFNTKNINKENYKKIIELCDYLMITNVDIIINHIIQLYTIDIVLEFIPFYTLSSYVKKITHDNIHDAVRLWNEDKEKGFYTYGHISLWNTSEITSMDSLFKYTTLDVNISRWDVSNVITMNNMFQYSYLNTDISRWDVSNVITMNGMFSNSQYNKSLNSWNVSKVEDMSFMFKESKFNQHISMWNVSNVFSMNCMFYYSRFNCPISNWDVKNVKDISYIFHQSLFKHKMPKWKYTIVRYKQYIYSYSKAQNERFLNLYS